MISASVGQALSWCIASVVSAIGGILIVSINGINVLGMGLGAKPDGYTMGYFTLSALESIVDNPAFKVKLTEFHFSAGARGWNVTYGRKDIPPGMTKPSDLGKATKLFLGGYPKASSVDTRLRLDIGRKVGHQQIGVMAQQLVDQAAVARRVRVEVGHRLLTEPASTGNTVPVM